MTNYIYICRQIKIFAMLYTKEEIQNWYWMPNTKVSFVQPMIVNFFYDNTKILAIESLIKKLVRKTKIALLEK